MTNELRQAVDDANVSLKGWKRGRCSECGISPAQLRALIAAVEQLDAVEKERDGLRIQLEGKQNG